MSCSAQKFLAAGHIGSFQIHPKNALHPIRPVQKRGLRSQEFLPRSSEHRPGDVEIPVSISGKLEIQNAADMVPSPEDIRIVEIAMAKTRVRIALRGWEKALEVI